MSDSTGSTESAVSTRLPPDPWGASFFRLIGAMGPPLPHSDDPKRTARAIRLMLTLAVALSLGIAIWVTTDKITAPTLIWGLMAAGSAMLVGGCLGFLFGLPSRRTVEIRNAAPPPAAAVDPKNNPAPLGDGGGGQGGGQGGGVQQLPASGATSPPPADDGASQDTGYVESTNLERVAEWLTTMIIGLTLTQYGSWEARYFDLSRNVTMAMEIKLDVCEPASAQAGRGGANAEQQGTRAAVSGAQSPASVAKVAGAAGTGGPSTPAGVASQANVAANAATPAPGSGAATTRPAPRAPAQRERDCFRAQAIPGGLLMAIFAIIGFLVSYLWMRRYFIFEMVTARKEEGDRYKRKLERQRIDDDPVLKAQAERDAAIARAAAATEAENAARADAAKIKADTDAKVAQAKADAEAAVTKARTDAAAQIEQAKADAIAAAAAEAAAITERLKTTHTIVEESASRDPVSGEVLREIAERTKAVAPQLNSVGDRLDAIIKEIADRGVTYPDDPWRDRVSQKAEAKDRDNGYAIFAEAKANDLNANLFDLTITVHADDAAANVGKGVWFLLHPTFPDQPRRAAFDANGDAVLTLVTYGAFTVGAIMEDGTVLELNLAEIPAPQDFRQR